MVAINFNEPEYIVCDHDSHRGGTRQDAACKGIPRLFCRLTPERKDVEEGLFAGGRAQMAMFLATVVLPADSIEPEGDDFSQYVAGRSRVADRIVVSGYTDDRMSMRKSEALALKRARVVKRILEQNGVRAPFTAIARPKCNYARCRRLSHRVEVAALFSGGASAMRLRSSQRLLDLEHMRM